MEKIKYSKFLLKRLVPIMLAVIIVCSALSGIYAYTLNREIQEKHTLALNSAKEINYIYLTQFDFSTALKRFKSSLAAYSSYDEHWISSVDSDKAMAIVREKTGEVIATSEFMVYVIIYHDDGDNEHLTCPAPEVIAFFEKYADNAYDIRYSEIYRDGDYFYPAKVEAILHGGDVIEADFTPSNADQYEYYSGKMMGFYKGTPSDSKALAYLNNHVLTGDYQDKSSEGYVDVAALWMNGERYWLIHVYNYDLLTFAGAGLLTIWIIGTFIGLFLSFAGTEKAYQKYCLHYEMDEYRRNMTTILAHDLKSPLTAIYGYAENLKNNVRSEKKDYYADAVLENVQYMNELITNTLELAKLETHDGNLHKTDVNITALAQELYSKYRINAENRDIQMNILGECSIPADKAMLSRALENLISNAVKFTPDKGKIEIHSDKKSFRISNDCDATLSGRTEDFCKPFSKGDSSRSDRKGSGIGLATVQNIMALHGFGLNITAKEGIFVVDIFFTGGKNK